jgi:tight adherence protein B
MFGAAQDGTLSLMVGLAVVVAGIMFLVVVIFKNLERKTLRRRLGVVTGKVEAPSRGPAEVTVRRDVADSSIATFDKLLKLLLPSQDKLRERLAATGKRISLGEYVLVCLIVGIAVFTIQYMVLYKGLPLALLLSVTAAVALPDRFIKRMIASRQRRFMLLFPEAIDLIVRGLKSGVPISESIKVVGKELPDPVGVEFRGITDSMLLGQSFDQALSAASKRINLADFRFFEISLGIQQETGGNLAETLENLGNILRKRKQMKQKVKALSSEARASAYILGSLPFLMFLGLYIMSPDYVSILFLDGRGHVIIGAAAASLATGVGVMIRMGKFQI